jgi:hypothetical protein
MFILLCLVQIGPQLILRTRLCGNYISQYASQVVYSDLESSLMGRISCGALQHPWNGWEALHAVRTTQWPVLHSDPGIPSENLDRFSTKSRPRSDHISRSKMLLEKQCLCRSRSCPEAACCGQEILRFNISFYLERHVGLEALFQVHYLLYFSEMTQRFVCTNSSGDLYSTALTPISTNTNLIACEVIHRKWNSPRHLQSRVVPSKQRLVISGQRNTTLISPSIKFVEPVRNN